VPAGKVIACT
jgi:pre-mRNA-splicing factor ATP-dependent RNA helicase DHX15/PRP43